MDRLKHLLLLVALLSLQQEIIAQNSTNSVPDLFTIDKKINESIFINTNANTFITGESLHYKLYCLNQKNNTPSKNSKIAYVELINTDKKSVFTHKLFLENGVGNGDFFIPTTLESGSYKLIGYTSWMLNQSKPDFFNIDIFVINPFQKNKEVTGLNAVENNSDQMQKPIEEITVATSDKKSVTIDLSKKTYTNREQVNVKLKYNSAEKISGNYTLSVKKLDELELKKQQNSIGFVTSKKEINDSKYETNSADFILPELRGEIISGRVISKLNGNNIENKNISLSIPGESYTFKICKTDKTGRFSFNLENLNTNPNITIQIIDNDKENYSIEMAKPKPIDYSSLIFSNSISIGTELIKTVEERAIASQIENAYYAKKKDSLLAMSHLRTFYNSHAKEYILDDYTRFPTLKETIIEIVDGLYYKFENNKYTLHLKDYDENKELTIPSLVIVDGLIIQDVTKLFEYKIDNVYKMDVVKGGYCYGSKLFNGVIAFTTKKFDYENNLKGDFIINPDIMRPLGKKEYFQPDYITTKDSRIPDYRHQLLWLPDITLNNEESNFTFYTSDVKGTFQMTLEGFTSEGKPIHVNEVFEVN
ncbi:MAG: hypothetical protein ABI426_05110 [Flavobacterium sp.]